MIDPNYSSNAIDDMVAKNENPPVPAVSVVAPCHNEEKNINALLHRVSSVCRELIGHNYEIVLVNDGSSDNTWKLITEVVKTEANIVGINLSRNYGHQLALSAGLKYARGDRILIIDADLQDPPELLSEMIELMDNGADVVYGQRNKRAGDTGPRKAASAIFYRLLNWLSDTDIPLDTGDFRLINRRVLRVLLSMPEQERYIRGMISWIGFKQVAIQYDRDERTQGETSYPLAKLLGLAVSGFTGFSTKPLRIATVTGILVAAASFSYIIYILTRWLFHGVALDGWPSLMIGISFLGAMQLLFLGIIGEYLGKVLQEVKRRPHFVVADEVRSETAESIFLKE